MKKNTQNCRSKTFSSRQVLFATGALCLSLSACDGDGTTICEVINDTCAPGTETTTNSATIADDATPGLLIGGLDGRTTSEITSPWLVIASMFRLDSKTPGTGDAYAAIVPYQPEVTMQFHVDFYTKELDTCTIIDLSAPSNNSSSSNRRVSGGIVSINSPQGIWHTLEKFGEVDDDVFYESDDTLPGALPEGGYLSIPGDVFPGPVSYPLYEPDAPVRLLPALDEKLTIDTQYSWMLGGTSTLVTLDFLAYDANGDFLGFPIFCNVVDDGSFTLPDNVRSYIATTEDDLKLRYSRALRRVDYIDGVVVYQTIKVAE